MPVIKKFYHITQSERQEIRRFGIDYTFFSSKHGHFLIAFHKHLLVFLVLCEKTEDSRREAIRKLRRNFSGAVLVMNGHRVHYRAKKVFEKDATPLEVLLIGSYIDVKVLLRSTTLKRQHRCAVLLAFSENVVKYAIPEYRVGSPDSSQDAEKAPVSLTKKIFQLKQANELQVHTIK